MQINVKLSPDVLDWVMAHIQQENVPRDVVKYLTIWKSGEKVPTFNQIEKVSKASGIPFGYFFPPRTSQRRISVIRVQNHRKHIGNESEQKYY